MNLREISRERILKDMLRAINPSGWKVLIVDQESLRIISAACLMKDITNENITSVHQIDIARQPMPNLEAIYFLTPKPESVDSLISDFKSKDKPMYSAAHLFFTSKLPDSQLQKISNSNVVTRAKTLKEFNLEFISFESQAFHLDMPSAMRSFFSSEGNVQQQKEIAATKLVTLMTSLNVSPIVRFAQSQRVAASFAATLQQRLDGAPLSSEDETATLLILDRSIDPISPLLHEFTYQAMIYDLLNIENDVYSYDYTTNTGAKQKRNMALGETDVLWSTLRHMHIANAIEWVSSHFDEFIKRNKASQLASGQQLESIKDMSEAVRAMPQYTETLNQYSLHISIANAAMDVFNNQGLDHMAHLEQNMATGEDENFKPVKNETLFNELELILTNPNVLKEDKMRLLLLYIIHREGIADSIRKRLMELAGLSLQEHSAIANISFFGVTLNKSLKKKGKRHLFFSKLREKKEKKKSDTVSFELSRYVPNLRSILQDLAEDKLSATDFPFVREPGTALSKKHTATTESLKGCSKQPRWSDKIEKKDENKPSFKGPRIFVFIVGGMTHAEMRTAYEISKSSQRCVVIGSTHVVTPKAFLADLGKFQPTVAG